MPETIARLRIWNAALDEVSNLLLDEFELTNDEIKNLALQITDECEAIRQNRAEAAWMEQQQSLMESGGPDDSAYRKSMKEAGRGHLLR